jgi:hypothetical protein
MKKTLAICGAFDRFNFGDLLFPRILARQFEPMLGDQWKLSYHGIVACPLASMGGVDTQPLTPLYRKGTLEPGSVVIIAGGEVLGATWETLAQYLAGPRVTAYATLRGLVGRQRREGLAKRIFGSPSYSAFVPRLSDFPVPVKIAYNAVGGTAIQNHSPEVVRALASIVGQASHIGVRDAETRTLLAGGGLDAQRVDVAPDCAVLMSQLFPIDALRRDAAPATKKLLDAHPAGYVAMHAGKSIKPDERPRVAAQLAQVHRRTGLPAMLLPASRIDPQDDRPVLADIARHMTTPHVTAADCGAMDMTLLLACSRAIVATSLHCNIIAVSYAVPHIPLGSSIHKLRAFLATWDIPEHQQAVPVDQLAEVMDKVLAVDAPRREQVRLRVIEAANHAFERMAVRIGVK